jgi:hypothetical protein
MVSKEHSVICEGFRINSLSKSPNNFFFNITHNSNYLIFCELALYSSYDLGEYLLKKSLSSSPIKISGTLFGIASMES